MQPLDLIAFQDRLTTLMGEAAKQAKVDLLPEDVAFSVRGDCAIANALIAPPENVPIEEADKLFLLYLSLPRDGDLAEKVPNGSYVVERVPEQTNPRARLVDLGGKPVLEVPLHVVETHMPPEWVRNESYTPTKEPITRAEAHIEQQRENLYRNIIIEAHETDCYPRSGVWYWRWIVIIIYESKA
jgi:hypothetical protein